MKYLRLRVLKQVQYIPTSMVLLTRADLKSVIWPGLNLFSSNVKRWQVTK
jgi:hypothetical protein